MSTRTLKNASLNTILAVLCVLAIVGAFSAFVRPANAATLEEEHAAGCITYETLTGYLESNGISVAPLENASLSSAVAGSVGPDAVALVSRGFIAIYPSGAARYGFEVNGCMSPPVDAPSQRQS